MLKVLAKQGSKWVKVGKATTGTGGKYSLRLKGTTKRKYRVVFLGGANLMGGPVTASATCELPTGVGVGRW